MCPELNFVAADDATDRKGEFALPALPPPLPTAPAALAPSREGEEEDEDEEEEEAAAESSRRTIYGSCSVNN